MKKTSLPFKSMKKINITFKVAFHEYIICDVAHSSQGLVLSEVLRVLLIAFLLHYQWVVCFSIWLPFLLCVWLLWLCKQRIPAIRLKTADQVQLFWKEATTVTVLAENNKILLSQSVLQSQWRSKCLGRVRKKNGFSGTLEFRGDVCSAFRRITESPGCLGLQEKTTT